MEHTRPPVYHPECTGCGHRVNHFEVLVYADSTGCEGPAVDPYHLGCWLQACDVDLPTNRSLISFLYTQVTSLLESTYGPRPTPESYPNSPR